MLRRVFLAALLCAPAPGAQVAVDLLQMPEADWNQHPGAQVPGDVRVVDEEGRGRALSELFGERPIVLALVYYECPMLCNLLLDGLTSALREVPYSVGEDFDVVALSIDPGETDAMARERETHYLKAYGRGDGDGWHFLVAQEEAIERVTEAVGFEYTYVRETDEYAHAAGIVVLTPAGQVSRYFFGIDFSERDLRLGLVDAGDGTIGSVVDKVLLRCFHYDPTKGKYGLAILTMIRSAGILTVALIALFVIRMLRRERRTTRAAFSSGAT